MERITAFKASDGSLWNNSREWAEHEFYLLLCECTMNADKEMAASVVDRFKEFRILYGKMEADILYGEGKRLGLVLDRRTIPIHPVPPSPLEEPDPEWRNKSRDHPSQAPLDQPVGVGTGMKLGGALDDVAF